MPMLHEAQPIYRICIQGHLSQTGVAWFEGFELIIDETTSPLQTCLQGPVMDQAEFVKTSPEDGNLLRMVKRIR